MSTTTIYITPRHLRAIAILAAGKNEIRTYLQGVFVEAKGKNRWLVATEGHALGVLWKYRHGDDLAHFSAIIPLPLIAKVCKAVGAKGLDVELPFVFTTQKNGKPPRVSVMCPLGAFDVPTVGGTFPNWRRMIPREVGGLDANNPPLCMSGALLGRMGECVAALYSGKKFSTNDYSGIIAAPRASSLERQGKCEWLVRAIREPDFVGVIMPMVGHTRRASNLVPSTEFFG